MKNEIYFEWDEDKNNLNIQKHGISFKTASLVFLDEMRVEYYDAAHSLNEDRYVTIGAVGDILCVVYTMRGEVTRIISARVASPAERNVYYGNY